MISETRPAARADGSLRLDLAARCNNCTLRIRVGTLDRRLLADRIFLNPFIFEGAPAGLKPSRLS